MRSLLLLFHLIFSFSASAEVIIENHKLVITGEILKGESESFILKFFSALGSEALSHLSLQEVELRNLSGGSVIEAIKISNVIEKLGMFTRVNGFCNSACALIYLSGAKRSHESNASLGVHSISFADNSLGTMSLNDAKQVHQQNLELFLDEFSEHGAPLAVIEQVRHTSSAEIAQISLKSIPIYKDFVREWAADRCGKISTENLSLGQQFFRDINDYVSEEGEVGYQRVFQGAIASGDPGEWFEELGKKFHPNFSHSEYTKVTKCYDGNLNEEFKMTYLSMCKEFGLECTDVKTKFMESLNKH